MTAPKNSHYGTGSIVDVEPSRAKKAPIFMGNAGELHTKIMQTMHEVLISDRSYAYLHKDAMTLLSDARTAYQRANLNHCPYTHIATQTTLFPWLGTRAMLTLALCAKFDQIPCEIKRLSLVYHVPPSELSWHIKRVAQGEFSARDLAAILPDKHPEKYDKYAPPELLDRINAKRSISMEEVIHIAANQLKEIYE